MDQKLILGQSKRQGKTILMFHTNYNALNFGLHLIQFLEVLGVPQDWLALGQSSFQYVARATQVVAGLLNSGRKICHDTDFLNIHAISMQDNASVDFAKKETSRIQLRISSGVLKNFDWRSGHICDSE